MANFISALVGIETGRVFGYKIIEVFSFLPAGFVALLISFGVFWILTLVAEGTIKTTVYTKNERKLRWKPLITLAIVSFIKIISIFLAALGGGLDLTTADRLYLAEKYTYNYIQTLKNESQVVEKVKFEIDKLSCAETNQYSEALQKQIANDLSLKLYYEIKKSNCQYKEKQGKLEISVGEEGYLLDGSSSRQQVVDERDKFDSEKKDKEAQLQQIDISQKLAEAQKDLQDKSFNDFVDIYFTQKYGKSYAEKVKELVNEKTMESLPVGDKAQVLWFKLTTEFRNGLIPTILVTGFIAIFLEFMSWKTFISVLNEPHYKLLYSNKTFQGRMKSVVASLLNFTIHEYYKNLEEKSNRELPNNVSPLVKQPVWQATIQERIREGDSPTIEALVAYYIRQFYRPDPEHRRKKN